MKVFNYYFSSFFNVLHCEDLNDWFVCFPEVVDFLLQLTLDQRVHSLIIGAARGSRRKSHFIFKVGLKTSELVDKTMRRLKVGGVFLEESQFAKNFHCRVEIFKRMKVEKEIHIQEAVRQLVASITN
jgi:hypothetical protein